MSQNKKKNVEFDKLLGFLRSKGIQLDEKAKRILLEKMEENPIDEATLYQSKKIADNKLFVNILDFAFTNRIKDRLDNPLIELIEKKRAELKGHVKKEFGPEHETSTEELEKVFYDRTRWESFVPVPESIGEAGIIVKVVDKAQNKPYVGLLRSRDLGGLKTLTLMTTKREKFWNMVSSSHFWRLKQGSDIQERQYISDIEAEFTKYIYERLEKKTVSGY